MSEDLVTWQFAPVLDEGDGTDLEWGVQTNGSRCYLKVTSTDAPGDDSDGDGLTNLDELEMFGTNPLSVDTDADGMPDGWEVNHQLNALANDSTEDPDYDQLTHLEEFTAHTCESLGAAAGSPAIAPESGPAYLPVRANENFEQTTLPLPPGSPDPLPDIDLNRAAIAAHGNLLHSTTIHAERDFALLHLDDIGVPPDEVSLNLAIQTAPGTSLFLYQADGTPVPPEDLLATTQTPVPHAFEALRTTGLYAELGRLNTTSTNPPPSTAHAGPATLTLTATFANPNRTNPAPASLIIMRQIIIIPVEVAVDADRNGEIQFGTDTTSAEKPYQFWVNNDRDIGHQVDIAPPPFGHNGDWEEDDVEAKEKTPTDADEPGIKVLRDLEDLSRIWIDYSNLASLFPAPEAAIDLNLRMESIEGNPSITLYQPVEASGGRQYLKSQTVGNSQLQGVFGQELCGAISSSGWSVPKRAWQALEADNVIHLLFEGKRPGKGKVVFEVHRAGQLVAALPPLYLDLKPTTEMYETWTVGDVISPEITNENNNYSIWPDAIAEQSSGQDLPAPTTDEGKDYVMFVHGWNMPPHEKTFFADTMFKRLWHQGFRGRFGAYRWPTFWLPDWVPEVNNFNGSEHRAWASGAPLAALLQNRSQIFNVGGTSKVRLYGHSMGNIVSSEALRTFGPAGAPIHTYVSGQAALAAHCWDANDPNVVGVGPRWMDMGGQWSNTANIYRGYWQAAAGADAPQEWEADGRPSYLHSSYMPPSGTSSGDTRYVNHHNVNDWALNGWELNQKLKPSVGYKYGWVSGTPFSSPDRFWHHIPTHIPRTLYCPGDRFEIFSWAAEARSYAAGAEPDTGGVFSKSVDLTADPFFFDNMHKGHSAQFRSFIHKRWSYWSRFLDDCDILYTPLPDDP